MYLSRSIKAFPNQQGLAAMMEKAGFEDVTWKNYTGGIAAVHVAKKPEGVDAESPQAPLSGFHLGNKTYKQMFCLIK